MTKILSANSDAISSCVSALLEEKLIIYPTDTLYGIGADATSHIAIEKVFAAKRRPPDKPVSVAVESIERAEEIAIFTPIAYKIAEKLLPGALTIILESRSQIPYLCKEGKIGIRIPDNPFTLDLLKKFGRPIVATSANLSGGSDPKEISEILEEVLECADIVVDQGRTKYAERSTIIDLSKNKIEVVREGKIKIEEIERAIK